MLARSTNHDRIRATNITWHEGHQITPQEAAAEVIAYLAANGLLGEP
jgi:hypothetical protein